MFEVGSGAFRFAVNPVIFLASTVLIWAFVIMCYLNPTYFQTFFSKAQTSVTV